MRELEDERERMKRNGGRMGRGEEDRCMERRENEKK